MFLNYAFTLLDVLEMAIHRGKPTVILAHTTKGKGVSFIENQAKWHGIAPKKDELEKALKELDGKD